MNRLRHARILACFVLAWFMSSLGVAIASPLVSPQSMQVVCSSVGTVKLVVQSGDGEAQDLGAAQQLDCPLCVLMGAPPPPPVAVGVPPLQPLGRIAQAIPAARLAAATRAPLPARGPPALF
ncbi:conserved exported hypothetical protein [Burkholderiales bacterium 8X]|nr:conserved exported hypothetical protein [Burkholderiales bacterium 8X]